MIGRGGVFFKEDKRLLVRVIRSIEKSKTREIGITLDFLEITLAIKNLVITL